jgi:hypothetical protein
MKRTLMSLMTPLVLALPLFSAHGADTPDFESQASQAHEAVKSSHALKVLREKPTPRIPKEIKEDLREVDLTIKQTSRGSIFIWDGDGDENLVMGGDIQFDDDGVLDFISFGPDLDAVVSPISFNGETPDAYRLSRPHMDVIIRKFPKRYEITGTYRKRGRDLQMSLKLTIQKDGQWYLRQDAVELSVNPLGFQWSTGESHTLIYGEADKTRFWKTELLILTGCVAAMTHVPHKDWPEWP